MTGPYKFGLRRLVPLGRLHWSAMRLKYRSQAVQSVDYLSKMPDNLGVMLNDRLGDCFEAAIYHGDQLRTLYANGIMQTQPDSAVEKLYELAAGYNPADPNSDQGSDPGDVFAWVEKNGMPMGSADLLTHELVASFEVDPRNMADVLEAMDACGGLMVGIRVPKDIFDMGQTWDYHAGQNIVGGHEILCGKGTLGGNVGLISWGSPHYEMTPAFWTNMVDQCTACVWLDWVEKTGKTPLGMTVEQLRAEMAAIGTSFIP